MHHYTVFAWDSEDAFPVDELKQTLEEAEQISINANGGVSSGGTQLSGLVFVYTGTTNMQYPAMLISTTLLDEGGVQELIDEYYMRRDTERWVTLF